MIAVPSPTPPRRAGNADETTETESKEAVETMHASQNEETSQEIPELRHQTHDLL